MDSQGSKEAHSQGQTLTKEEEEQWNLLENKTKPSYYKSDTHEIDALDVIEMFDLGFFEGNVIKYLVRWKQKNGLEDLHKASEYLRRLIAANIHRR
jgi:hypothetical protein